MDAEKLCIVACADSWRASFPPVQSRFFEPKPYEEFYDLEADPDEVRNLAADPAAAAATMQAMRTALDEHMLAINDNGFIPEGSRLEGYLQSRIPGVYPLREIMQLAALAAGGDADRLTELTASLDADNEVIRYWAATGLLVRAGRALPAADAIRKALARENVPQVRIVLAETLTHVGAAATGVAELAKLLAADQPEMVRLQALNALTYVDDPSAAMPLVHGLMGDPGYLGRAATYLARVQAGTFDPHVPLLPPRG